MPVRPARAAGRLPARERVRLTPRGIRARGFPFPSPDPRRPLRRSFPASIPGRAPFPGFESAAQPWRITRGPGELATARAGTANSWFPC